MSKRYAVDAYAWIEYLRGSEKGRYVRKILEGDNEVYTCSVTLAEVVSKVVRSGLSHEIAYQAITSNSRVIEVDAELSKEADILHVGVRNKVRDFSLADAYVLACSKRLRAKILTGDPHFKDIPETIMI